MRRLWEAAVNRVHAVLDAARRNWRSRWERPAPRHGAKPPEPPSEPEHEPEGGVSPAQMTLMDGFPPARIPPYVKPDDPDGPKHRRPR
jgi:hypothetical protein